MFSASRSICRLISTKNISKNNTTWNVPQGYDTGIKVYNCIVKETVPLIVKNKNYVSWYTCGPTIYDSAHMGHASCYIKLDIIQRILRNYFNLNVVTAMNITDVDDKIIRKSQLLQKSCTDITKFYEEEFWNNMESLGICKPNIVLRVSENIAHILSFIEKLLDTKQAYVGPDNSVYFDVIKYKHYGKLQKLKPDDFSSSEVKQNSMDFALWKASKSGEPFWESKFGTGRPGWHIECSTLASKAFGPLIDIHAGGLDLRFPHHENEETQSCAYHNVNQWVNYWMHTGQLHIKSEKMSKSLNNSIKINDYIKVQDPDIFRLSCLLSHYRNSMDYNDDILTNAQNVFHTYTSFIDRCNAFIIIGDNLNVDGDSLLKFFAEVVDDVDTALRNDFDTAVAMKKLNNLISATNKILNNASTLTGGSRKQAIQLGTVLSISNYIKKMFSLFGIDLNKTVKGETIDNSRNFIDLIVNTREKLRDIGLSNKDKNLLTLCDGIRDDLIKLDVNVKDHGKKSIWNYR